MNPVTLRVDARDIEVDTKPLPCGGSNFRVKTLAQIGDHLLVLKSSLGMRLFAAAFLLLGAVPLAVAAILGPAHPDKIEYWVVAAFGAVFFTAGLILLLLPQRIEFDLLGQQMTRRRLWRRSVRPLADILAVQLIPGGWHTVRGQHGVVQSYYTYQVNLILDDDRQPRLNIVNQSDWDSTWQCGDRLVAFLGVPFLDRVSGDDES